MKLKKRMIALVASVTLLMNVLSIYAGTISVNQAWNQLSNTQQSKLKDVGLDEKALKKIDAMVGESDISGLISKPPLTYKNDRFTVSQTDIEQALFMMSLATGNKFESESMVPIFNDVIADINSNSSETTRQDFATLLGKYGMVVVGDNTGQLPGGGPAGGAGIPIVQENIQGKLKEKLEEKLHKFQKAEQHSKLEEATFQKMIEVLSGQLIDPSASITTENVQNAWKQSLKEQEDKVNGMVFAKTNAPVARWDMSGNSEVTIPKGLWESVSAYGRIELEAGSVVLSIEKNTYTNNATKITLKPFSKEGYNQAVTISSTAQMYSPVKLRFYIEDEKAQDYGVYKLEDNKEILIGGIYNESLGAVEALVKSSGTYVVKKTIAKTYNDLADVDWAKNEINHLGQKGYIGGKSEGIYAPKDDITRAEFAVLLTRILQLPTAKTSNKFKDMKEDAWYYSDVMATVEANLFNGKSANDFDPSGKITRQEVAAVISRILVQKGYSEPKVEKVEKGVWAPGALALINEQSLTAKVPDFNDNIAKNANRAEVAYILYNLLQR